MLKEIRFVGLAAICALACGARVDAQAVQSPASSVPSPQIAAARSVFIMNAGSENREEKARALFSGGPTPQPGKKGPARSATLFVRTSHSCAIAAETISKPRSLI